MSMIAPLFRRPAPSSLEMFAQRPGQPSVSLQDGQLRIVGTKKADDISVVRRGDVVEVRSRGELIGAVPASQVRSVDVRGGRGNDNIAVDVGRQIAVHIDGGRGNDFIRVDNARDAFVQGGRGHDHILGRNVIGGRFAGGRGNDSIDLIGARGSVVDGGRGNDRLRLVGGRNNTLRGGRGNDELITRGARGSHLEGGPGVDVIDRGRAPWQRALNVLAALGATLFAGLDNLWQRLTIAVPGQRE
jgi:hypothetical protein